MKKSFFSSPALALALAFITPIFFAFSQNWHMVEPVAMLASSGIVFLLACGIFVFMTVVIRLWGKIAFKVPQWLRWLVSAVFLAILVETCCFFLQSQLVAAIPNAPWLRIICSRVLPFFILAALIRRFGFYPLNVFLTVFLSFSVVTIGNLTLMEVQPLAGKAQTEASSLASCEFKKTPNIYLFFLESYHSLDIQRSVYGIDTNDFENYLANNGFVDYGKVYSNTPSTLLSFADTFRFSSSMEYARGNSDVAPPIRRMLEGNSDNTLLRILKANGYTTVFLMGQKYLFGTLRGEFLDDSDGMAVLPPYKALIRQIITCIGITNARFREEPFVSLARKGRYASHYSGSLEERVSQAVALHRASASPLFLTFKGGALHSPPDGSYTWRQREDWVRSGTYQEAVKAGTEELRRICDKIITEDPGAIIVLLGDHGSWRLRRAEEGGAIASTGDLIARVQAKGIPFQDFCDDGFAVFLGIRLPYGQRENLSHGLSMSHVNLFRHVFAYLSDDPGILKTREPSDSYWRNFVIVTEGKVVTEP